MRCMPAGGSGRAEVFDEHGIRLGFIELPPLSRVIGFGADSESGSMVYLARTDEMGLSWLERYRVRRNAQ